MNDAGRAVDAASIPRANLTGPRVIDQIYSEVDLQRGHVLLFCASFLMRRLPVGFFFLVCKEDDVFWEMYDDLAKKATEKESELFG